MSWNMGKSFLYRMDLLCKIETTVCKESGVSSLFCQKSELTPDSFCEFYDLLYRILLVDYDNFFQGIFWHT